MSKTVLSKRSANSFKIAIIRHLREWHRKLGIIAAFFLIFLSLSGIALNHTESLNLAHYPIKNQWLLNHYGIKPPQYIRFYENSISVTDNLVWLNDQLLMESEHPIIAVSKFQQFWLVTSINSLSFYDNNAQLIDQLNTNTDLPANISAVSITDNLITLNTENGYFQTDENFIDWISIQTLVEPTWQQPKHANNKELTKAQIRYQSQFLTIERIVLDAHSGRIAGGLGILLMDLVAIILILLSISGLYIWLRYWRAKR